jgi:probable HAF family extracellular repeat protein
MGGVSARRPSRTHASGQQNWHKSLGFKALALPQASDAATHAFLWSGGTMTDLRTLGGSRSVVFGINDTGQVVGYAYTASGAQHPFLYSGGQMLDLNTLIPSGSGWSLQEPRLSYSQQAWVGGSRKPALAASRQQPLPVLVIPEDRLPPVAPIHDVINPARILDAQVPSHGPRLM